MNEEELRWLELALDNAVAPSYEDDKGEYALWCGDNIDSARALLRAGHLYLKEQERRATKRESIREAFKNG